MDDQSDDSFDSDDTGIANGYFGIPTEEKDNGHCSTSSVCDSKLKINVTEGQTTFNTNCEETADYASHDQPTSNCASDIVENQCFGSRILDTKSLDSNSSDQPSTFATITKDYEKSIKNNSKPKNENLENGCQVSQLNSKSTAFLPSLSMISNNYQDSSSESDESVIDVDKNVDSDDDISIISVSSISTLKNSVKTKGELDITDLPPIEDLKISVDEEKCQPIGCIKSIVDTLVVVEAFFNQPALDIDSILFLDRGKRALGKIFDVFGPVNKPYYAVRFNNPDHIKTFNVLIKEPVFCAPETEHSSFVLVSQLLKMKGSDASWKYNNEPPPELLDYSDDEAEKLAKKKRKQNKNSRNVVTANERNSPEPTSRNVISRNRPASVDSAAQNQSFSRNQSPRPYSPRPPHFRACPSNYNSQPSNFNLRAPNFNPNPQNYNPSSQYFNPSSQNFNPSIRNFNPSPHRFNHSPQNFNHSPQNFNASPQNFNPSPQSFGFNQRPPYFPSYAQQLSAMEYRHSYQPIYPEYSNLYPPRQSFPYRNPQIPPGYSHHTFPQDGPNNPTSHPNQMN